MRVVRKQVQTQEYLCSYMFKNTDLGNVLIPLFLSLSLQIRKFCNAYLTFLNSQCLSQWSHTSWSYASVECKCVVFAALPCPRSWVQFPWSLSGWSQSCIYTYSSVVLLHGKIWQTCEIMKITKIMQIKNGCSPNRSWPAVGSKCHQCHQRSIQKMWIEMHIKRTHLQLFSWRLNAHFTCFTCFVEFLNQIGKICIKALDWNSVNVKLKDICMLCVRASQTLLGPLMKQKKFQGPPS